MTGTYKGEFTTPAGLKANGWTDAAIRQFLGEPDKTAKNWHYRSGPPQRLYAVSRVLEVEKSEPFRRWLEQSAPRKASARRAVETKREQVIGYMNRLKISVPHMPDLITRAIEHYNERGPRRWKDDDYWEPASRDSDPAFLDRISVNYLRHEMTSYEDELTELFGRVASEEAGNLLREKIYAAIAEAYPKLSVECVRQLAQRRPV